jgi:hypothetical protein
MALDANRNNYYCTHNHRSWQNLENDSIKPAVTNQAKFFKIDPGTTWKKYQTKPTVKESVKIIQN